jgi:argininosuccinate lyase
MRKGRFSAPPSELAQQFSESLSVDRQLFSYDIAGSLAHAATLLEAGVLSPEEHKQIEEGLRAIQAEIEADKFKWDQSLEDVHMNIEAALTKRIGAAGAKLHTARSRNDQIALDLRLYVKSQVDKIFTSVRSLQACILNFAEQNLDVIMPGYTHLQRAQPIFFAHYLLAQIEALDRDADRLRDCRKRTDVLPLGAGALAGSTIVLNREIIARQLGFSAVSQNSVDAVSDRDFVCEFLFCLAMIGMHLSRLSEDMIIWSTTEFGFVEIGEAFSTGSSLMPQKKNPDMAELTRGKTGRLYGNLLSILTTLKGLPFSYNRDLQEDKGSLFDSVDTILKSLEVWAAMLPDLKINSERMEAAASGASLLATDLAEYLVEKGVPFRQAHEVVAQLFAHASKSNVPLDQIPLVQMRESSPLFGEDVRMVFNARRSLEKRKAIGAPSPENVKSQLERWRKLLGAAGGGSRASD